MFGNVVCKPNPCLHIAYKHFGVDFLAYSLDTKNAVLSIFCDTIYICDTIAKKL